MFDLESGLKKVNVDYSGDGGIVDISEFDEGTTEKLNVSLDFSCCVRSASFSLIDVAGNGNFKEFFKGPLRGEKLTLITYVAFSSLIFSLCNPKIVD